MTKRQYLRQSIAEMTAIEKDALFNEQFLVIPGIGHFQWLSASSETAVAPFIYEADEGGAGRWFLVPTNPTFEAVRSSGFTLAATDTGKRFVCTATLTVTLPALTVLGNGFTCEVINGGAGDVTIAGATSIVLDPADVAIVMEANGKQRVIRGLSEVLRS